MDPLNVKAVMETWEEAQQAASRVNVMASTGNVVEQKRCPAPLISQTRFWWDVCVSGEKIEPWGSSWRGRCSDAGVQHTLTMHYRLNLVIRYQAAAKKITPPCVERAIWIRLDMQMVDNIMKMRQSTDKVCFISTEKSRMYDQPSHSQVK